MSDFPDPFASAAPPLPPPPPAPPTASPGAVPVPPGYVPYDDSRPMFLYSGWWRRAGAFVIDGLIAYAFAAPGMLYSTFGPQEDVECLIGGRLALCSQPTSTTSAIAGFLMLAGIVGFLLLYCLMASRGGSLGQRATGIRIVDARTGERVGAWRIFGRRLASYLSAIPCYLGFLWPLWDQRKQAWHDMIAKTVVVKAR